MHCAIRNRRSAGVVTGVLVISCALLAGNLSAARNDDLDRIREEINRLKRRQSTLRQQQRTAEEELEAADVELGIRSRELEITLDMQSRLERERESIVEQIFALQPRIEKQKDYLRKRLVALYRLGGLSYLRMFLSLAEQQDPSAAMSMLNYLITHDGRMISRFQSAQEELALRQGQLTEQQKQLALTARTIEHQRREMAQAYAAKERLLARLQKEASGSAAQIAELEEKARRLERLVELVSKQGGGFIPDSDVRTFRGALAWPAEGEVIERFGRQRNAKFATYTMNNGLKIAAAPRSPVRAVFQGTVLFSQWFKGYGNLIILDHGNRVFSLYGNLTAPSVAVGDRIATGQAIAGVGDSEDMKSGYLYFEVREDNRPEDPQKWLR